MVDYAAGWAFADSWTAGVGGYWTQQLSSDEAAGNTLDHSKARGFAIGPSLKYDDGKGRFVTAKLRREIGSHNRAEVQDSG